jgi:S-methylmethionine-dependent homocysteine/selenocysteine methylase
MAALYRESLPQLSGRLFLTDGGLETTLVFLDRMELPCFAAFPLLESAAGRRRLRDYFAPYIATAKRHGVGFLLGSPTWRANADWGARLGFAEPALGQVNRRSIEFLSELRAEHASSATPIVIDGIIGPRGDGYRPGERMSEAEAERYHGAQIDSFREGGADMVEAQTLNYPEEAIGIAHAALAAGMPVAISFTVETDGRLPSGETLQDAVSQVDRATENAPAYYMINCAHPTHFADALAGGAPWLGRLGGLRCNASRKSHAELDAATELDAGDPAELGRDYRALRDRIPHLSVLGGCCGTDHRHIAAIAAACVSE